MTEEKKKFTSVSTLGQMSAVLQNTNHVAFHSTLRGFANFSEKQEKKVEIIKSDHKHSAH